MPRTRMYKKQFSTFLTVPVRTANPAVFAPVEADARRYLEWGATFVAVGSDLGVFRSATQKLADTFKK